MIYIYIASSKRYEKQQFVRAGSSGLKLSKISLGCWLNFGDNADFEKCQEIVLEAFDNGITYFDLANNYGPPPGAAELTFGKILANGLIKYRDELVIATKAGFPMWDGPYGNGGSRKHLMASLDQSLKRLGISYVDIFYHHRSCHETPLAETILALRDIVNSGKALYIGLSNYNHEELRQALLLCRKHAVPCILYQPPYSLLDRRIEKDIIPLCREYNIGIVGYSALAQGRLSDKYLTTIPDDSRIAKKQSHLSEGDITLPLKEKLWKFQEISNKRNQSISQTALAWVLHNVDTAIVGVSRLSQLKENLETLENLTFSSEELSSIEEIFKI